MSCNKCDPHDKEKIPEKFSHKFELFLPLEGWVEKTGVVGTELIDITLCINCISDALSQLTSKIDGNN